jgi:hypothetical protein
MQSVAQTDLAASVASPAVAATAGWAALAADMMPGCRMPPVLRMFSSVDQEAALSVVVAVAASVPAVAADWAAATPRR